jgi:iron complex outermembrane receptor protein
MRVASLSIAAAAILPLATAVAVDGPPAATQGSNPNSSLVQAASAAPADNGADTGEERGKLQEITVTATRRSESLDKVPISINALSQQDLAQADIKNISDLTTVTPGLQFGPLGYASTLTLISIRGLDSLFGASTVGIYLDDTPIQGRLSSDGNVGNPYPQVFDLKRVEVERGPQGTLFGSGSEAGTVRFISNEPSLSEYSGFSHAELSATQGGTFSYEVGAAGGGPIVQDKVGFRASIWDRRNGGYAGRVAPWSGATLERNGNTDDTLATRLAFAFQAGDATRITPSVYYQAARVYDNGRFDPRFSDPSQGIFNNVTLLPETSTDRLVVPGVKLESDLSFADLTAVASYTHRKADLQNDLSGLLGAIGLLNYGNPLGLSYTSSPADVSPLRTGTSVHAFTEEVRLASKNRNAFFTWVAGIFNDHRTQVDYQLQYSSLLDPTGNEIFYTLQSVKDDQIALFGQGDFHFTDQWIVTVGERVARVRTDQRNTNGTGVLDALPQFAENRLQQSPSTPRGVLSYQADRNNLFYLSASKGFRIGGANDPLPPVCGPIAVPSTYTADTVLNYEVGAKNVLFNGRLKLDTSAFHILWSNIQQLAQPACGISYTINAGKAVSNGFDLALQSLITDQLRLDVAVAYADAHFTENAYDSQGRVLVSKGDKIGYLPFVNSPWDVNTAANYELPLRDSRMAHLRIEYQYHSRNPGPFVNQNAASPNYSPQEAQNPPTNLWNARAGLQIGKVDMVLFANNIFNSHPLLGKYGQALLSAPTYSTFRPRTVGVSANLAF